MPTLLHVDSSPLGEVPLSRRLTREFVVRWRRINPEGRVIARDLAAAPIPVIDAAWITANLTPREARTPQQHQRLALSTEFTRELLAADEYVIGTPMHNWGPAASLKLWIDQIVRFGETLTVTPAGPRGNLGGKRATFIIAAGQDYRPGSASHSRNYLEPWLRTFFGYLGMADIRFIFADRARAVRYGELDPEKFLDPHIERIDALFEQEVCA
ncbi:MAG: NAD(P)H-dependent oxidoreductase [Acidobacteriaceae bacterium]|jgi:FMN-dependent NADH-azoreductase